MSTQSASITSSAEDTSTDTVQLKSNSSDRQEDDLALQKASEHRSQDSVESIPLGNLVVNPPETVVQFYIPCINGMCPQLVDTLNSIDLSILPTGNNVAKEATIAYKRLASALDANVPIGDILSENPYIRDNSYKKFEKEFNEVEGFLEHNVVPDKWPYKAKEFSKEFNKGDPLRQKACLLASFLSGKRVKHKGVLKMALANCILTKVCSEKTISLNMLKEHTTMVSNHEVQYCTKPMLKLALSYIKICIVNYYASESEIDLKPLEKVLNKMFKVLEVALLAPRGPRKPVKRQRVITNHTKRGWSS
jgi:hypothetical protein